MNEENKPTPSDNALIQGLPEGSDLLAPLPNESPSAYAAFLHYFEMKLPRSLRRAAEELGASENTLEDWSVKYQWRKRIQAYCARLAARRAQVDTAELQQQERAAQVSFRLIDRSEVLLDEQIGRSGDKLPVPVILRMIDTSDRLARSRRAAKVTSKAAASPELRKELAEVAQISRQVPRGFKSLQQQVLLSPGTENGLVTEGEGI